MSRLRKGLVLALEEMENDLPVEEVSDTELMETRSDMDDSVAEVEDFTGDIEEEAVAIEEALNDIDTLSDIKDTMEDSVEGDGEGLDETSAEIAEVAVEAICARLGFQPTHRPIPATESFGRTSTRRVQTQIAIEGLSDTISRAWEAVKGAVGRIADKVKLFLSGLTKNTEIVVKHLRGLKDRVATLDPKTEKTSEELSNKSVARAFSENKEANFKTAYDIVSRTNVLIKGTQSVLSDSVDALEGLQKIFLDASNPTKVIEDTRAKVAKSLEQKFGKLGKLAKAPSMASMEGAEFHGPFVNCGALVVENETEIEGKITWIQLVDFKEIKAETAKALDVKEMAKLLDSAIAMVEVTGEFAKQRGEVEKAWAAITEMTARITAEGKGAEAGSKIGGILAGPIGHAIGKEVGKVIEEKGKERTVGKALKEDLESYMFMVKSLSSDIPGLGITTGKAVGDYVTASMGNYKAPQAEAPKEEASAEEAKIEE